MTPLFLVQPVFDEGGYSDEWGTGELVYADNRTDAEDLYFYLGDGAHLRGIGWLDSSPVETAPDYAVRSAERKLALRTSSEQGDDKQRSTVPNAEPAVEADSA